MRTWALILFFTCACIKIQAQVNIITTICGNGTEGYNGDGIPAIGASITLVEGLCLDNVGNIYIADVLNQRIRKITLSTGIISTIAGTGNPGFSGDNTIATNAELFDPSAVFTDTAGNVYIADAVNNRIRKVSASTGIITTIAGSGATGLGDGGAIGDGGPATNATLSGPVGLCLDNYGNIYIADYGNNKIRKVVTATGIITTFAGIGSSGYSGGYVGYSGDGGLAINAVFSGAIQVFADSLGNVFVCDQWNHAVRKVNAVTGIITTIAGTGTAGYFGDNGPGTNAQLDQPTGVFVDKKNNVFIADYWNGSIRKVDGVTGIITTIAGNGTRGFSGDDGPATDAELKCTDVFLDSYGNLFIADQDNNRIREVSDPILGVASLALQNVKVYPNPVNDELNITGITQNTNYQLLNVTGSTIVQGVLSQGSNIVPMKNCVPGIYILEMTGADGQRNIVRVVKD